MFTIISSCGGYKRSGFLTKADAETWKQTNIRAYAAQKRKAEQMLESLNNSIIKKEENV